MSDASISRILVYALDERSVVSAKATNAGIEPPRTARVSRFSVRCVSEFVSALQAEILPPMAYSDNESGYYDVYVLAAERSDAVVRSFRDHWLTGAEEAAVDYPFPQFDDSPSAVYSSAWELIQRLLVEPDREYAVYWTRAPAPGDDVKSAHLFFTSDGGLIAGVTVGADRFADTAATLRELALSVDAHFGYVTGEEPPASDATSEFKAIARGAEINLLPD